jgi:hypothetical protein
MMHGYAVWFLFIVSVYQCGELSSTRRKVLYLEADQNSANYKHHSDVLGLQGDNNVLKLKIEELQYDVRQLKRTCARKDY